MRGVDVHAETGAGAHQHRHLLVVHEQRFRVGAALVALAEGRAFDQLTERIEITRRNANVTARADDIELER
jgi:hypothetical protein